MEYGRGETSSSVEVLEMRDNVIQALLEKTANSPYEQLHVALIAAKYTSNESALEIAYKYLFSDDLEVQHGRDLMLEDFAVGLTNSSSSRWSEMAPMVAEGIHYKPSRAKAFIAIATASEDKDERDRYSIKALKTLDHDLTPTASSMRQIGLISNIEARFKLIPLLGTSMYTNVIEKLSEAPHVSFSSIPYLLHQQISQAPTEAAKQTAVKATIEAFKTIDFLHARDVLQFQDVLDLADFTTLLETIDSKHDYFSDADFARYIYYAEMLDLTNEAGLRKLRKRADKQHRRNQKKHPNLNNGVKVAQDMLEVGFDSPELLDQATHYAFSRDTSELTESELENSVGILTHHFTQKQDSASLDKAKELRDKLDPLSEARFQANTDLMLTGDEDAMRQAADFLMQPNTPVDKYDVRRFFSRLYEHFINKLDNQ